MLDLVEAQFSLDTLKSAFGTTNVEPIVRCHQIPRVVNVPGYTPLIPRIDELFNVQPNIYGTNQEVDQAERNSTRQCQVAGLEERSERR